MNQLQVFNNEEFGQVRTVKQGEDVWFVAKDVADVLEYRDTHNMVRFLDEDEKDTHQVSTLGGNQIMKVINESGLYSAILKSKKTQAKAFKKWVTSEVLPSIRKHGAYMTDQALEKAVTDPDFMIGLEILIKDGKEYFPAVEVAKSLGYSKPHDAITRHCTTMGTTFYGVIDSLGRKQEKKFINEGNLYRLIVKSKLPQAEQFEKWAT
ncbi:Bro-N domain-containing protein [Bacillus cytotoxicus]|uniref:BRO-N domain-containing protein n=1 Tax=Bacillus cytotoxicus TaxID=580165 RepID=UPI0035CBC5CE